LNRDSAIRYIVGRSIFLINTWLQSGVFRWGPCAQPFQRLPLYPSPSKPLKRLIVLAHDCHRAKARC